MITKLLTKYVSVVDDGRRDTAMLIQYAKECKEHEKLTDYNYFKSMAETRYDELCKSYKCLNEHLKTIAAPMQRSIPTTHEGVDMVHVNGMFHEIWDHAVCADIEKLHYCLKDM